MEFTLLNGSGAQIGAQFSKTLAGHAFQAFNPFIQAGVPYSAYSFDNAILRIRPTSGAGKVMCFGATVDNTSNDPAAHVAVQGATGYDNGPGSQQVLPEVIWASATGGGTWMSAVQVTDVSGGSQVSVYYNTASGRRGPFVLWNNSTGAALSSYKIDNLLETIDGLDSGTFSYYGTVGAVEFVSQDGSHLLQAAARTLNGSYAKTLSALNLVEAETADTTRAMLIQNYTNNSSYRSTCGFFNPTADCGDGRVHAAERQRRADRGAVQQDAGRARLPGVQSLHPGRRTLSGELVRQHHFAHPSDLGSRAGDVLRGDRRTTRRTTRPRIWRCRSNKT